MSIQNVPPEVLLEIFRHVSKPTLINCAVVCKSWYGPTIRLIYENVTLSSNPNRVYSHFDKKTDITVRNLVRNLKFGYGNVELTREDFCELLLYLRYIKIINLQSTPYQSNYLTYMNVISNHDCLNYLEDLIIGSVVNAPELNKYFQVLYNCRNSLKVLNLNRVLTNYQIPDQPDKSVMYYLREFKNLTHLVLVNNRQDNGDPQLSLLYTLKSCPNLVELSFENKFEIDEDTEMDLISDARPNNTGGLLTRADSTFEITQSLSSATLGSQQPLQSSRQTIDSVPTLKDLKQINLKLKNITGLQVKNMLSYLPNSLNILKLRITGTATGIWIQRISESTLKQLGEFLCRVNQVDISFSSSHEDYTGGGDIPNSSEVMSKFFPLMNFIVGEKQLVHSYASINVTHMGRFKFNPQITIRRNHKCMTTTYDAAFEELNTRLSATEQSIDPIYLIVPQSKFGGKLSYKMAMLTTIEILSYEGNIAHVKYIGLIQSAISTCPRLRFFIISADGENGRDCSLKFGCVRNVCDVRSSRSLYRDFDNPYNNALDNEKEFSMTTKERIKYVLLENARTTMASIKLIADSLPHLKVLKITGCRLEEDEYRNTTLDLRGAEHLEKLLLDIAFTGKSRRYIFFKVEFYAADQQEEPQVKCYMTKGGKGNGSPEQLFKETTPKYLKAYHRFESTHSSTIIVECQKLSEIGVSYGSDLVLYPIDIGVGTTDSDSSS